MSISDNVQEYSNIGIGAFSGLWIYERIPKYVRRPVSNFLTKNILPTKSENDIYLKTAIQARDDSPLLGRIIPNNDKDKSPLLTNFNGDYRKKVEFVHIDETNSDILKKHFAPIDSSKKKPNIFQKIWRFIFGNSNISVKEATDAIVQGKNAFFNGKTSVVVANQNKNSIALFHEMGHAIDQNGNKFLKWLCSLRRFSMKSPKYVLIPALLLNKPKEQDKTKMSSEDKCIDFYKRNCGLLAFVLSLPVVAEEGLASINGAKLAKKYLNKDMYKKLNIANAKCWGTYLCASAVTALAVQGAVYLRDKIVDFKPIQKMQEFRKSKP